MTTITGTDSAEVLEGGADADLILGLAGDDTLNGAEGNDTLDGGAGADSLNGGEGSDTVTYASAAAGVLIDVLNAANNTGDAAGDSFSGVEVFEGSG